MKNNSLKISLLLIVFFILSGCASVAMKPVSQDEIKKIKTIALVQIHDVDEYKLLDFGNPLGVLAGGVNGESKSTQLHKMLKASGFAHC
jgi:hypothetical protein